MVVINIGSFRFVVSEVDVYKSWVGDCFYIRAAHCYLHLDGMVMHGDDILGF